MGVEKRITGPWWTLGSPEHILIEAGRRSIKEWETWPVPPEYQEYQLIYNGIRLAGLADTLAGMLQNRSAELSRCRSELSSIRATLSGIVGK